VTHSLFRLVREPMRIELRAALHAVRETGESCESNVVGVVVDGQPRSVVMRLKPALDAERRGFVLVIFDDTGHGAPGPARSPRGAHEAELTVLKERLNAVIAEFETSQEEMKAGNEELQSTNEELRSTMEELETSKEELQSMNEELSTLNQENRHKVEELSQLAGDLQNLLAATDIATLFLDRHLRILRFTPQVGRLFNVRGVDRGRPLSDLTHRLGYDSLIADARLVLAQLVPVEREVVDDEGRWYLTRVLPYRTADDRIEGVVITFIDITARKAAEEALARERGELATELAASRRLHRMMVDGVVADGWQEALDVILAAAVELQGADFGVIYLVSDATGDLVEVAQRGFAADARAALAGVDRAFALSARLASGAPGGDRRHQRRSLRGLVSRRGARGRLSRGACHPARAAGQRSLRRALLLFPRAPAARRAQRAAARPARAAGRRSHRPAARRGEAAAGQRDARRSSAPAHRGAACQRAAIPRARRCLVAVCMDHRRARQGRRRFAFVAGVYGPELRGMARRGLARRGACRRPRRSVRAMA
jgi:PAS domain-containing protein